MNRARGNTEKTTIRTNKFALQGDDVNKVMIHVIFEVTYHVVKDFHSCQRYRIVQSTGQDSLKSGQEA